MKEFLLVIQIIVSVTLIGIILTQSRGGGLGSAFGGSGQIYRSKRGIEKLFVYLTISLAALFFVLSVIQLLIN
ncbi:preprotein translocase subunit SecG [Candidatus Curtissbacteria bacterium RIFCSPLOWO2_01_FULL_39_62]|uniref:Protein-export membrane protein SecG n=2 Tax=Candidatus Curtissiibacteriota TaxID=1752717 RepID=A0A1F5GCB5_9BACT|nr:MAG: preprotein translocase subunit SecG [Candidatus Curtissbacteria bacterium RIFCSPHIGHO2_01_FULL_39_57]OGD89512.1 MAG: preprotein translocase subunit SecG [Candidatus Curtissbacteria bacterium RIFCSPHIGHO2_02_FULL_40_16b]OGD90735.1 MAG: preprotein translocase subunit SecG [Candidatus Curtissbacteria bacterium RIFCSPHIGHO2_12_FULL_38_37]OGD99385.1 MAG: preprotein translocase subunit SecG [Candidatus Curtissbacteria bacterium RIFCSPLOWO2_02_FULL_40_11]OGE01506.1 MAG: preprotein translocase 